MNHRTSATHFALACCTAALILGATACHAMAQPAPDAPAAPATPVLTVDTLLDKMEVVRKDLRTFQADATKLRRVEILEETEKFTGTLQFKAPRLLRMEMKSLENGKVTIIIVGPELAWIYRPQEKQAEQVTLADLNDAKKSGNPLEYGLSRDIHGLKEGYVLKLLPAEKVGKYDTVPLEMTPTEDNAFAAGKVVFWIDTASWLPVQVREWKSNGEIIETHTFTNVKVNEKISDKVFEFDRPKGVDIIIHEK